MSTSDPTKADTTTIPKPVFEELFRSGGFTRLLRYFRFRGLSQEDAEDLASEVAIKVVQGYDRIPPSVSLNVWLMVIARNCLTEHLRSSRHRQANMEGSEALDLLADLIPSDENIEQSAVDRDQLQKAIRQLERERPGWANVVQLFVVEGKTISEIAGSLGRSAGATRQLIYMALKQLRDLAGGISGV